MTETIPINITATHFLDGTTSTGVIQKLEQVRIQFIIHFSKNIEIFCSEI